MTISKRWIQRGVLCGLLLGGVVGCSMIASPPVGQIANNDHAALAAWYDKEAAQLRQKAKDMEEMAVGYQRNPNLAPFEPRVEGRPSVEGRVGSRRMNFAQHCERLSGMYTKAAEEADQLAQGHRDMLK